LVGFFRSFLFELNATYQLPRETRVNICPYQGSRTIRTEEAVLITLSRLSPFIAKNASSEETARSERTANDRKSKAAVTADVVFSDDAVSDESSDDE
jgi:hypothetical protein